MVTNPVLFTIFNRPQATRRAFTQIQKARPPRLYVAADGPRPNHATDADQCRLAREFATAIDWECEVQTLFRDSNVGCGAAISTALSWFFTEEEQGVIVEDDCICDPTFFQFSDDLLNRYAADPEVMFIAASNLPADVVTNSASYRFTRIPLMWGWATWSRAWALHDQAMSTWPNMDHHSWLRSLGFQRWDTRTMLIGMLERARSGKIDTWDLQWIYSVWNSGGIGVVPRYPLVQNVGFGVNATHTRSQRDPRRALRPVPLSFPIVHPSDRRVDRRIDEDLLREWFRVTPGRVIDSQLQNLDRRLLNGRLSSASQAVKAKIRSPLK